MRQKIQQLRQFWQAQSNRITLGISLIALIIFVARGLYYVDHMAVNMDEGTYLLKGKYYLEGRYQPYQPGGPVTNKGVFSFWILGLSQLIVPGLQSGRLFTLFLSAVMLVVMWLLIRRFGSQTWAAGILLLFALSGFWISVYSRAISQAVTACLMVLSVYLLTGKSARGWHLSAGLLLGVVISLTRQNLVPFYAFTILFVIWQYGIKKSWLPIVISLALFVGIHLLYWPEMYRYMWRPYVRMVVNAIGPANAALSEQVTVAEDVGEYVVDRHYNIVQELRVIFNGVAVYLVPTLFSFFFLISASWRKAVKSETFKIFIFLFTSNLVLAGLHLAAVLQNNNILYSYPIYPAFFLPLGLIILPLCWKWMNEKGSFLKAGILTISVVALSSGIGLFLHRTFSDRLMFLTVPRVRDLRILAGTTELWRLLENKFHPGYKNLEFMLAAAYGLLAGLVFVALCAGIWLLLRRKIKLLSFSRFFLSASLITAAIFSPNQYLAGQSSITLCEGSTPQALMNVADRLKAEIEPGSLIYWENDSPAVLLTLEDIELYPLQLNNHFYRRVGGDAETLLARDLWNDEVAERWLLGSDYVLLDEDAASKLEPKMNSDYYGMFDKIEVTDNLIPCQDRTYLHVYKNLSPAP